MLRWIQGKKFLFQQGRMRQQKGGINKKHDQNSTGKALNPKIPCLIPGAHWCEVVFQGCVQPWPHSFAEFSPHAHYWAAVASFPCQVSHIVCDSTFLGSLCSFSFAYTSILALLCQRLLAGTLYLKYTAWSTSLSFEILVEAAMSSYLLHSVGLQNQHHVVKPKVLLVQVISGPAAKSESLAIWMQEMNLIKIISWVFLYEQDTLELFSELLLPFKVFETNLHL